MDGGRIRGVPVTLGGTSYVPPIPNEIDVKERIAEILSDESNDIDKAVKLCMYCMKAQIFLDGNKRATVIFANHYLIAHGGGFIVIPENHVTEADLSSFRKIMSRSSDLLVRYYDGEDFSVIKTFLKENCWKTF